MQYIRSFWAVPFASQPPDTMSDHVHTPQANLFSQLAQNNSNSSSQTSRTWFKRAYLLLQSHCCSMSFHCWNMSCYSWNMSSHCCSMSFYCWNMSLHCWSMLFHWVSAFWQEADCPQVTAHPYSSQHPHPSPQAIPPRLCQAYWPHRLPSHPQPSPLPQP